jgi:hypothetical protein
MLRFRVSVRSVGTSVRFRQLLRPRGRAAPPHAWPADSRCTSSIFGRSRGCSGQSETQARAGRDWHIARCRNRPARSGGGAAACRFRSSMFVLFFALAFNCLVQFAAGGVGWGLPGPALWAAVFGCSAHVCSRPVCQRVGGCARGGRIDGDVRPVTHRYFPLFLPMPRSCEL